METKALLKQLQDQLTAKSLPSLEAKTVKLLPDVLIDIADHEVIDVDELKHKFKLPLAQVTKLIQLFLNLWYLDVAAPDGKDELLSNLSLADLKRIGEYGLKPLLELSQLDGIETSEVYDLENVAPIGGLDFDEMLEDDGSGDPFDQNMTPQSPSFVNQTAIGTRPIEPLMNQDTFIDRYLVITASLPTTIAFYRPSDALADYNQTFKRFLEYQVSTVDGYPKQFQIDHLNYHSLRKTLNELYQQYVQAHA